MLTNLFVHNLQKKAMLKHKNKIGRVVVGGPSNLNH